MVGDLDDRKGIQMSVDSECVDAGNGGSWWEMASSHDAGVGTSWSGWWVIVDVAGVAMSGERFHHFWWWRVRKEWALT